MFYCLKKILQLIQLQTDGKQNSSKPAAYCRIDIASRTNNQYHQHPDWTLCILHIRIEKHNHRCARDTLFSLIPLAEKRYLRWSFLFVSSWYLNKFMRSFVAYRVSSFQPRLEATEHMENPYRPPFANFPSTKFFSTIDEKTNETEKDRKEKRKQEKKKREKQETSNSVSRY